MKRFLLLVLLGACRTDAPPQPDAANPACVELACRAIACDDTGHLCTCELASGEYASCVAP